MLDTLCSVDKATLRDESYIGNQTHKHTFTCTKRGEKTCRFNIPYWPMAESRVLLPLSKDDARRAVLQRKATKVRERLETRVYSDMRAFLIDNKLDYPRYLDMVRSTIKRPTVYFKRDLHQIYINTFNPLVASVLNSNSDLQLILDEYSCASYVVEYVNKSNRGMSQLHRELIKLHEEFPDCDGQQLLTKVGLRVLNSVEMSAQEAAWYLLRQPMSQASRYVTMIPTVWPCLLYTSRCV